MSKISSRNELVDDLPISHCDQKSAAPDVWALPVVGCGDKALGAVLTSVIDGACRNRKPPMDKTGRNGWFLPLRESRSYINLVACQP